MADKKVSWFKRHKVLTVILALVLIGIVAGAAGGGKESTNSTQNSDTKPAEAKEASEQLKLGQAARDGKFEFTVASVTCNNPSVADSTGYLTKNAQGQYCIADITVKNIGNEAQTLDSSSQYLYNASGQKYSADGTASIYANPSGSTFLNSINPGNSASGKFVFDIPKDQTPVKAELHDSAFSSGVSVTLQ